MPTVLLLSTTTGYQLRSFGAAAEALGVRLRFATDRCHALDDPWRDGAIPVRFHEEDRSLEAIARAAAADPIDGVVAVGDRPVVLAARVAEALGLPGNPPDAARASAHKRRTRERLAAAGLPVPPFFPLTLGEGLGGLAASAPYPVVIKPVGLSGSRGVIRADGPVELQGAFERIAALLGRPEIRAMRTGTEEELLVEGFVHGREYAVEGLLTDGVFRLLAVFDKPDPLEGPFFEETIYVTPPADAVVEEEIAAAVSRGAAALGLRHGPIHAECRVGAGGVVLLEIAARPIGGLCSRVLRFEGEGARTRSLEHLLLAHALGRDLSGWRTPPGASAVMMIPIPGRGVFKGVRGEPHARAVAGVEDVLITAKPGGALEPLPEAGSYLGFIFARAAEPREAEAAVRAAHAQLEFTIDRVLPVVASPPPGGDR